MVINGRVSGAVEAPTMSHELWAMIHEPLTIDKKWWMNCSFYSRHCPTTLDPFSKFIVFMFHVSRGTPFWTYCVLLPVLHVIRLVIRSAWVIVIVYDIYMCHIKHTYQRDPNQDSWNCDRWIGIMRLGYITGSCSLNYSIRLLECWWRVFVLFFCSNAIAWGHVLQRSWSEPRDPGQESWLRKRDGATINLIHTQIWTNRIGGTVEETVGSTHTDRHF